MHYSRTPDVAFLASLRISETLWLEHKGRDHEGFSTHLGRFGSGRVMDYTVPFPPFSFQYEAQKLIKKWNFVWTFSIILFQSHSDQDIRTENTNVYYFQPENIMCVSETGNRIKLIDFGLAQYYDGSKDLYYMAGTPEFAAPEVIYIVSYRFWLPQWSSGARSAEWIDVLLEKLECLDDVK